MADVKLKVMEALQEEAYKGIVRIDSQTMRDLGVRVGDVVEITGGRTTVGIVDRAYPTDVGQSVIRMDGILRRNAKTSIGEFVVVKLADVKECKKLTVAPSQPGVILQIEPISRLKIGLLGRPVIKGDQLALGGTRRRKRTLEGGPFDDMFTMLERDLGFGFGLGLAGLKLIAVSTQPKGAVMITENTEVSVSPHAVEISDEKVVDVTYEDIGGLGEELKKIREMIELPLKHPEIFERLGIEPPKGVLLYGPPGTGKTLLAKAVANETNAHFIHIDGPSIISKFVGEAEKNIREIFDDAQKNAPSIIFIDEIDAIAPKREESYGEVEKRVVAQLLATMDGLRARGKVIVIAATNRPNALDPALRRPGRFDREVELSVPKENGRLQILQIHTRNMPLSKDVDLKELARVTHGFVGADLESLCKEAAMVVLRRVLPDLGYKKDEPLPAETLEKLEVGFADFLEGLKLVRPSALREVFVEAPDTKWGDIGGLEDVKQELKEAVEWPLKYTDKFKQIGIRPPKGVLLYGPPGTGKTLLAKAVAHETESNFILVNGPELLCVSADTKILTDHCGTSAIEKFYENILPISVLVEKNRAYEVRELTEPVYSFAIGRDGKVKKTKIKTIHKLWVDDACKIDFANGAELVGSANQPLLVYKNDSLEWISLKNIRLGDFVAYPRKLRSLNANVLISLPDYKHLRLVKEDEDGYFVKIFSAREITRLPKKLTPELAAFLGWFAAEGNISKESISICNNNESNKNEIVQLFKQFVENERIKVYKDKIVVYSTPLVEYLERLFEQSLRQKKSYNIKCPSVLAKASEEVITAFLRSAYKGDGSITETKIEYGSMSKLLVEGIAYLLTILGIKSRYWGRKDGMYMLTISGKVEINNFRNIIFDENNENNIREEYNAQYIIPPIFNLLKRVKEMAGLKYGKEIPDGSFEHVISGRRKLGLFRLQKIMKLFKRLVSKEIQKTAEFRALQKIARGDFLWTQVKTKTKTKPQMMFDVETEHHSFVGGNIPLLLHNSKWVGESEKAVKKIFEKARQASPSIIFFDEIDAIAPRRGRSDGDSGVTERVVNQLLTEIDGLQELTNVVVIGATNRPDIIDPALLRSGRFDRIILTPTPDEKARIDIFKIHTKKMPLTKDVKIDSLVQKTHNYVGSDIEAVCREAGMLALRRNIDTKEVSLKDFSEALKKVGPSIRDEDIKKYGEAEKKLKVARAAEMGKRKDMDYFG